MRIISVIFFFIGLFVAGHFVYECAPMLTDLFNKGMVFEFIVQSILTVIGFFACSFVWWLGAMEMWE